MKFAMLAPLMAGAALGLAQPAVAAEGNRAADEAAVAELVDALEGAWAAGDAEAFSSLFVDEAYFTTWFGNRVSGQEDLLATRRFLFANVYPGTALKLDVAEMRFIGEDVALIRADGWVYGASQPAPTENPDVSPLLVFERVGGEWKVAAFQNTPVQEPPAELPEVYGED